VSGHLSEIIYEELGRPIATAQLPALDAVLPSGLNGPDLRDFSRKLQNPMALFAEAMGAAFDRRSATVGLEGLKGGMRVSDLLDSLAGVNSSSTDPYAIAAVLRGIRDIVVVPEMRSEKRRFHVLADGRYLNQWLVTLGLAEADGDRKNPFWREMREAEDYARSQHVGGWGTDEAKRTGLFEKAGGPPPEIKELTSMIETVNKLLIAKQFDDAIARAKDVVTACGDSSEAKLQVGRLVKACRFAKHMQAALGALERDDYVARYRALVMAQRNAPNGFMSNRLSADVAELRPRVQAATCGNCNGSGLAPGATDPDQHCPTCGGVGQTVRSR